MGRSQKENEHRLALHPAAPRPDPGGPAAAGSTSRTATASGSASATTSWPSWSPACAATSSWSTSATSSCSPSRCIDDVAELREGQVLWGWPHCVQDQALTQLAVDRRLTLIAFEAMNHWKPDGSFNLHVFHKNNELAGYALGAARHDPGRHHRQLRPPAERRRHRLRGDRPRCRDGADRARGGRRRHPHPPPGRRRGLADPLRPDPALRPRRHQGSGEPRRHPRGAGAAGGVPRPARHHRQLRAAGHRHPAGLPRPTTTWPSSRPARGHRRVVRRGHGLQLGPADHLRRPHLHRSATTCSTTRSTTARRTCGARPPGRSARPCCRSCAP